MTKLFTEQAQFAKANNHVYVNGIHYDEAKAQRDLKQSAQLFVRTGQKSGIDCAAEALYLLRKVFIQQEIEVKVVDEPYEFNGKQKIRKIEYFNGMQLDEILVNIATANDFVEEKKLTIIYIQAIAAHSRIHRQQQIDRAIAKGREPKPIQEYGKIDDETLFTPWGIYEIDSDSFYHVEGENIVEFADDETPDDDDETPDADDETPDDDEVENDNDDDNNEDELDNTKRNYVLPEDNDDIDEIDSDSFYHVEGENIIEFAEDENNNEEITVTKGNKNSLLWRIDPDLSMKTEKVYTASFSGFDNDFAENPDVSEQFNEFIDFVKDEVEKYVEDTAIIKSERRREQLDLEAKPSWMSQELYDLLE